MAAVSTMAFVGHLATSSAAGHSSPLISGRRCSRRRTSGRRPITIAIACSPPVASPTISRSVSFSEQRPDPQPVDRMVFRQDNATSASTWHLSLLVHFYRSTRYCKCHSFNAKDLCPKDLRPLISPTSFRHTQRGVRPANDLTTGDKARRPCPNQLPHLGSRGAVAGRRRW